MDITSHKERLKLAIGDKRYQHSLGVMDMAAQLAKRYGADVKKAKLAGLLHDCAKGNEKELLERYGVEGFTEEDFKSFGILHATLGAMVARDVYGVADEAVLEAISLHTTGAQRMSTLAKIIYIADAIELGRVQPGVELLRKEALRDLDEALIAVMDDGIRFVLSKGALLHSKTLNARNYYIERREKKGK